MATRVGPAQSPRPATTTAVVRPAAPLSQDDSRQRLWWYDLTLSRSLKLAFASLLVMFRNVLVSTLVALATSFCISRGFSALSTTHSSRTPFLLWSLMATFLLASLFNVILHSSALMKFKFIALAEGERPSLLYCVKRLTAGSWIHFCGALLALVATGLLFSSPLVPVGVDKYKLEFYMEILLDQVYFTACQLQSRAIFFDETTEGHVKQRNGTRRNLLDDVVVRKKKFATTRQFLRMFLQLTPSLLSMFIAGAYVHIVSQWQYLAGFNTQWFVGGSLILKLTIQEIAKHYLVKTQATNLHHMCVIVSVPTVLIDTQVRVVILASQAAQSTLRSSYILAAIEVSVRLLKIALIHRTISKKKHRAASKPQDDFDSWRDQVVALHIAETQADMYSEYIAIACSGAIALFWSNNPLYSLSDYTEIMQGGVLVKTLLYQVAIELAVDYCGSSLEIYYGVGMAEDDRRRGRLGSFLGFFVAMLAVMNINMSAVLYIRPRLQNGS